MKIINKALIGILIVAVPWAPLMSVFSASYKSQGSFERGELNCNIAYRNGIFPSVIYCEKQAQQCCLYLHNTKNLCIADNTVEVGINQSMDLGYLVKVDNTESLNEHEIRNYYPRFIDDLCEFEK